MCEDWRDFCGAGLKMAQVSAPFGPTALTVAALASASVSRLQAEGGQDVLLAGGALVA